MRLQTGAVNAKKAEAGAHINAEGDAANRFHAPVVLVYIPHLHIIDTHTLAVTHTNRLTVSY